MAILNNKNVLKKLTKILALVVVLISVLVMIGWVLDIPVLKSILPQWVTMKFTTAFSFFLSGIILYALDKNVNGNDVWTEAVLPITSLVILLLMASLFASVLFGISTGIENLFVREMADALKSSKPGQPSIGTMVNFILIAITGISAITKTEDLKLYTLISGVIVTVIGTIALVGYLMNLPVLYYYVEGVSSAMAVHTAILFLLIGAGFVLISEPKKESLVEKLETPGAKTEVTPPTILPKQ